MHILPFYHSTEKADPTTLMLEMNSEGCERVAYQESHLTGPSPINVRLLFTHPLIQVSAAYPSIAHLPEFHIHNSPQIRQYNT